MLPFCSKTTKKKHLLRLNQNVQIKKLKIITLFISTDYQIFHLTK